MDGFVGALLEGQPDVETEAVLAASSTLGRAHDPVAAASDDHVIVRDHLAREFFRHLILRFARRRAGRTEDADLAELRGIRKKPSPRNAFP